MMTVYKNTIILFGLGLMLVGANAQAAGLAVVFEATPLFSEAQIMPGDSVARTVTVTNNSTSTQDIEVLATNVFSDGLASVINLTVTAPGENYFGGSLEQFFTATPLSLGDLAVSSSRTYTFTASLPAGTDNPFILKNAGFDLVIGFVGGERVIDNPERRSGGGGDSDLAKLRLFDERVVSVSVASSSAVISWQSNLPASSYLVCGKVSDGPFVLSEDAPLFGYQFAVPEVDSKQTNHSLLVTGLDLVDYECRPAGRRSTNGLFTVGQPVQFGFPGSLVEGASISTVPTLIEPEAKPWLGKVLGDQISQWPLGGLALGSGGFLLQRYFLFGLALLVLLTSIFLVSRKRKPTKNI